jgi:hypothetical protein
MSVFVLFIWRALHLLFCLTKYLWNVNKLCFNFLLLKMSGL